MLYAVYGVLYTVRYGISELYGISSYSVKFSIPDFSLNNEVSPKNFVLEFNTYQLELNPINSDVKSVIFGHSRGSSSQIPSNVSRYLSRNCEGK